MAFGESKDILTTNSFFCGDGCKRKEFSDDKGNQPAKEKQILICISTYGLNVDYIFSFSFSI